MLLPRQFSSREKGAQGAEESSILRGSSGRKRAQRKAPTPLVETLSGWTDAA
jgi:hypothetical protein